MFLLSFKSSSHSFDLLISVLTVTFVMLFPLLFLPHQRKMVIPPRVVSNLNGPDTPNTPDNEMVNTESAWCTEKKALFAH